MKEEQTTGEGFREGVRTGIGVLSAFKEAIEETIDELRERGDLSPERAREVVRSAMEHAATAMGGARERFDFVTRRDLETLREEVAELRRRVADLEGRGPSARIPINE